jgi:hypothetical protein
MDMSKEFPAQTKNRLVWIIESVRENQEITRDILSAVLDDDYDFAKDILGSLHRSDRDALTNPEGIFTQDQLKRL